MQTIPSLLEARLQAATAVLEGLAPQVSAAADARFGDYQSNAAMVSAKRLRKNPRELAQLVIDAIDVADLCEPPEIAGAGFINFRLRPEFVAAHFARLLADEKCGVPPAPSPITIVCDFSAPNIAKPMHVGHIRSTILGDALTRIARFLGHKVVTDNHIGDWGTQFGKVIYGWKHFLVREALATDAVEELVRLYKEAHALSESEPAVLDECRQELVKLQTGDAENTRIWREAIALSRQAFDEIYEELHIEFDEWLGESFYNDRLQPLVDKLLASGVAEVSEGAVCVFFPGDEALAERPCLIRKSDGAALYATTDLATIAYRLERWEPDEIWYVTGAPQQLHFQQVFAVTEKAGLAKARLRHIPFGSILGEDRKVMKTRSGANISLRDLLAEARERALQAGLDRGLDAGAAAANAGIIGLGALKYSELSQFRMTDYIFAWDKMLSLQGNTAPYLQNAYVRIQSIFRKLEGEFVPAESFGFSEIAELSLAKKLFQFGEIVPAVLHDFRPNLLATYLYELANTFHGFYEACPVLKSEGATRESRLALCRQTAATLQEGLGLLGIDTPERM